MVYIGKQGGGGGVEGVRGVMLKERDLCEFI